MARKHNARHAERGRGHYRHRLAARGARSTDVMMAPVEDLRRTQSARQSRQGHPWPSAADRAAESDGTS